MIISHFPSGTASWMTNFQISRVTMGLVTQVHVFMQQTQMLIDHFPTSSPKPLFLLSVRATKTFFCGIIMAFI